MADTEESIVRRIRAAFEREPRIDLHRHPIRVAVEVGAVALAGEAASAELRNCAIRVGAQGVFEMLREGTVDAAGAIEAAVSDGIVTFEGQVASLSHKRLAGVLAWWTAGCRDVVNSLAVMPDEVVNDLQVRAPG